ncbi:DUF5657 family protein [Patescibacteria group bacterium]
MNIEWVADIFTPTGFIKLIQILVTFLVFLYTIFALLTIRQVKMLNTSLKTDAEFVFTVISYIHMFISLALLTLAFIVL